MTFSILASDFKTGELCVATATYFLAVGNNVPKIIPDVGAIVVQASAKTSNYRNEILNLIKKGVSTKKAVTQALKNDKLKEERQIAVINLMGNAHVFSGNKTVRVSDSFIGKNFAIAGNMLANKSVVSTMAKSFQKNTGTFLPKRLIKALIAGEKRGGDKRGRLSAAIIYYKPHYKTMTLRIDYSNNPLKALLAALELRYSEEYISILDS